MLATKSTLRCDTPRRWNLTRAALIAALFGAIPAAASEGAVRWRGLDGASGEL